MTEVTKTSSPICPIRKINNAYDRRNRGKPKTIHKFFLGGWLKESVYQAALIRKLKRRFKGCIILKNDSAYIQGIPDLLILYRDKWAMLEVKPSPYFHMQPNQEYYINKLGRMSFASFIFPEIEEDVLRDLQHAFSTRRQTRVSQRQQASLDKLR